MFLSKSAKSHHPWIQETRFEPLSQKAVLEGILETVRKESQLRIRQGGKPVKVIFDLDSTIFDVKPRTLRILKEFAATTEAKKISAEISEWCSRLRAYDLLYTLEESARANGIPDFQETHAFMKAAFQFWRTRFFQHHYLFADHPTAGAVEYAHQVIDAGGYVVYLTGRDWPGMGRGTQSMLDQCGFPVDPRVSRLLMKPNAGLDDSEYKDDALRELRSEANAVALFDNEPANFYVFEKNFPEAWLVFFHSNCSSKEALPVKRVHKIDNFLI